MVTSFTSFSRMNTKFSRTDKPKGKFAQSNINLVYRGNATEIQSKPSECFIVREHFVVYIFMVFCSFGVHCVLLGLVCTKFENYIFFSN